MSKFDKYRVSNKPVSKFDKYRVNNKPVSKFDKYRVEPERFIDGHPAYHREYAWKSLGMDREKELEALDKEVDKKTGNINYWTHDPTWGDRAKELGQGLAGGIGTMADLAGNYVAAPATFLASKSARGQGKLLKFAGAENAAKMSNKIADDLQQLSNKYWNQNTNKEFKEADILKTKNRDTTSAMLRGAGEFAPDLIPANLLGKGVRAASTIAHGAAPIAKKVTHGFRNKAAQWLKEPKLPKLANLMETPLTGVNLAGFAGAGAGHGFAQNEFQDRDKNPIPFYLDVPAIMAGAGVGGGLYGAGKAAYNLVRGNNSLPFGYKSLAKKINKGNNALDEDFIKATKSSTPETIDEFVKAAESSGYDIDVDLRNLAEKMGIETVGDLIHAAKVMGDKSVNNFIRATGRTPRRNVTLTPFNIYKDNKVPFKIAKNNSSEQGLDVLPRMKQGIHDEVIGLLDNSYVKYDRTNPKSDLSHTSNLIAQALKDQYKIAKHRAGMRYEEVDALSSPSDYATPSHTIRALQELYTNSRVPMKKGSGIGKLNTISGDLLADMTRYEGNIPVKDLVNQKRAISQIIASAPAEINGLRSREITLLQKVNDAIDSDLMSNSVIANPDYLKKLLLANKYFSENVVPFKNNSIFKKVNKDANIEKLLVSVLDDKNKSNELNKLLQFSNVGKGKGDLRSEAEYRVNKAFADTTKLDLDWAKRLETEKRLFNNKGRNSYSDNDLLDMINSVSSGALYKPNVTATLRNKIRPLLNKYRDINAKDKKYLSGLSSENVSGNNFHDKYDIAKYIQHWPTVLGAAAGAQTTGALGALIGGGIGAGVKKLYSTRVMSAMNDKQFVNELIRLGRLPKEEKQSMIIALLKRPVLKTEIIKSLLLENKDNEKASK